MEVKVLGIYKSEYQGYFTITLEVSNERFESVAVFSKSQIREKFNLSDVEFENLKK